MATLHVHLDESGDWTFNPKGAKYFVLAVAWTYDPQPLASALTSLRLGYVAQGDNIESFHASPDKQNVRNSVVQTMLAHVDWDFAAVLLEKSKINPSLYPPEKFYPQFAGRRFVFTGMSEPARPSRSSRIHRFPLPKKTRPPLPSVAAAGFRRCPPRVPRNGGRAVSSTSFSAPRKPRKDGVFAAVDVR